ncbi:MAG: FKBP-type peptidyl-prolyl cis-trans isomerase [Gammaproteobacteria bacterium]|nr:FKBP-type peptidyl-prolyl cis-trans isomerase [Gammaproteobacteria bacterium]
MSNFKPIALAVACAVLMAACGKTGTTTAGGAEKAAAGDLTTDQQKFSYAIGYDLGHSLQEVKDNVDLKALETGLEEGAAGTKARLDEQQRQQIKVAVSQKIRAEQQAKREAEAKTNQEAADKFLAEMAKKPGVKTTADGLEYEVEKEGSGKPPKADDHVTVNYKGMLPDGTVFDSSYERGQPATLPLADVIPAWGEGLQLMKPGAKYKFYVSPKLAYGERGAGLKIGPNQALVFEVELLNVGPNSQPGAAAAPHGNSR